MTGKTAGGRVVTMIHVHHTATPRDWTVEDLRREHMDVREWSDVGYTIILRQASDDLIPEYHHGRDVERTPASIRHHNTGAIAVAIVGNFELERVPSPLYRLLVTTLADLCREYAIPVGGVFGHRELAATACPGQHLDLPALRLDVAREMYALEDREDGPDYGRCSC